MKKPLFVIFALAAALVLFGCINPGGAPPAGNATTPPAQNGTQQPPAAQNGTGQQPSGNVGIIVGQQQNVTVAENLTVQKNVTPVEPPKPGMQYTSDPDAPMSAYFIYAGQAWPEALQGESIYIKKGELDVVIDAGSSETGSKVADFLRKKGADDIDLLISTAADRRRYGGMPGLLEDFRVEEFWWGGDDFGNQSYREVLQAIKDKNILTRVVGRGFTASANGLDFIALNPKSPPFGNPDNDAVVLRINDRNFSMLLASNMKSGATSAIVNEEADLIKGVKVLDAPYYGLGAGTSGIELLLTTMKPKAAMICGEADDSAAQGGSRSPFKNLLAIKKITYMENYVNGTVVLTSTGKNYTMMYTS